MKPMNVMCHWFMSTDTAERIRLLADRMGVSDMQIVTDAVNIYDPVKPESAPVPEYQNQAGPVGKLSDFMSQILAQPARKV